MCRSKAVKGYKVMPDNMCQDTKPIAAQTCNVRRCPSPSNYQWRISPWGPVSIPDHHYGDPEVKFDY